MEYTIDDLTIELMEQDAVKYLEVLEYLEENFSGDEIKGKLNEKLYNAWYGNHLFCLVRLVGSLNENTRNGGHTPDSFFGSGVPDGVPEDLGITILDKIVKLEVNIHDKDYYDDNIFTVVNHTQTLTYRDKNNDKFKQKVREYFSSS